MAARDPATTRARLLAAAGKEFNTRGYFATDTNRIARRAGSHAAPAPTSRSVSATIVSVTGSPGESP